MSFTIIFCSPPLIPLLLPVLSSMMEKPIHRWMIFLTIVQLMMILMILMMTLINLHRETSKEVQVDVVEIVNMGGKVVDRKPVIIVELTVDMDVVVVLVKVMESKYEIVNHQLLRGKIWKMIKYLKIQTLWNLTLSVQVWNVVPYKRSHHQIICCYFFQLNCLNR